ncbi:MAG TPA: hypothetical protein VF507_02515 [Pyrinomonadaceae bacterium]
MALVSRTDKDNNVALYDVPESELERYRIPPDRLAEMFPPKEGRSRADAMSVASAAAGDGDVQAYSSQDVCYAWECDTQGKCVYVWWYC